MNLIESTTGLVMEINNAIEKLWLEDISKDHRTHSLLKEDSLKNAFYYHLRNRLTDDFLLENHLRIYTEFYIDGIRADLAVVQISENPETKPHLQDSVIEVLAIVEMKYKTGTNDLPYKSDIAKIEGYISKQHFKHCQYYLAFVQEAVYESDTFSWLEEADSKWAESKVTELNGYFYGAEEKPVWLVQKH